MAAYSGYTDGELAALIKGGDGRAYTEIFSRYSRLLISHAYRLLGDRDEANDVVQDVMLTLWQKREELEFKTSLSSYLYTAIRNRIFNRLAHLKHVAKYADEIIRFMENGFSLADDVLREKEFVAVIENEINALPEKMRAVFLLHKREELNYKEIAEKLGISDKTAKQQVYNATKILKSKLTALLILSGII
ncbi:RNA polymerase sigma factor [Pedobacter africanus]|uniref:RNA polymerase sigma-70 factor, ECF subfamily n=1 Tax=Pedobacter africanus TaxID=151894 RepID=A0A1W2CUR9_9SPHI|nr:RNA polymerase sigma-70 factor [Pedobacter africanus]SMC88644.1 RNA polymerase sigma-70 factor, ECF subfamily [Pedobacter africanus]